MELGDSAAPGCFFHIQIRGQDDTLPWPKSVDVPRFPGIVATPASVVEFVLGEMFQDDWPADLDRNQNDGAIWLGVQRRWWQAILHWQQKIVDDASGSPWAAIKSAKPDRDAMIS